LVIEEDNMAEENKVLEYAIEDGKLVLKVDPNKNGKYVVKVEIDMLEVPSEIVSAIKK
jgi:hypothetical protein